MPEQNPLLSALSASKLDALLREFAQHAPKTYRAIFGKKYLLPQHRQADYVNQDVLNQLYALEILKCTAGLADFADNVQGAEFANLAMGLQYERPIVFLEREIGEGLRDSELLANMQVDDLRWRWPAFRVMLPEGLLTIMRNGAPRSLAFVDVSVIKAHEPACLPRELALELNGFLERLNERGLADATQLTFEGEEENVFNITGTLNYAGWANDPTTYAFGAPWELTELVLRDWFRQTSGHRAFPRREW